MAEEWEHNSEDVNKYNLHINEVIETVYELPLCSVKRNMLLSKITNIQYDLQLDFGGYIRKTTWTWSICDCQT